MTTAAAIPVTHGELEGDEALETLRGAGRRRLLADTVVRFRAADGFSHARALAFQLTLALLPAIIAVVGFAATVGQEDVTRAVRDTIHAFAPGAVGDILTQALQQGSRQGHGRGQAALVGGLAAALFAGTSAMAQVERSANRLYGIERDRPFVRRYAVALLLAVTAGGAGLLSLVAIVGGAAVRSGLGDGDGFDAIWHVARWPVGVAAAVIAVALLFEVAPDRRQPEWTWLAVGAAISALLWLAFMGLLVLYVGATGSFGATYGPIAGTIGVLAWAFGSSIALLVGLAFAAQLEAVRAGVRAPRVERTHN
jgi:YihY family inner membrane protein